MPASLRPLTRARLARQAATALLPLLGGCGGGSARQTLEKVASAAATARLAASELAARHTTAPYTASTLRVLRSAVAQDAGTLTPDALPPAVRERALAAVALARGALDTMADAARRRDTTTLARAADRADAARHALDAVVAALPEK